MRTRQKSRAAASVLLAMAMVLVPLIAAQERNAKPLTAQDHAEIQQLYARYHWVANAGDGRGWAMLFSADGEYSQEGGSNRAKGRDELIAIGIKSFNNRTASSGLQFTTNVRFEASAEGARGGSYGLGFTRGEPGKPATVSAMVYEDVIVKTSEGWRFKSRKTYLKDLGLAPALIMQAESAKRGGK